MTLKCEHPQCQVICEYAGSMSFGFGGPSDDFRPVYFCKSCRQVVEEKDLPWLQLQEPVAVDLDPIPL